MVTAWRADPEIREAADEEFMAKQEAQRTEVLERLALFHKRQGDDRLHG